MKFILSFSFLFAFTQINFAQNTVVWEAPMDIAPIHYSNQHPRITTDASGKPMVVWGKKSVNNVNFARGTGSGFATPITLNPNSIPVFTDSWAGPDIATHGDTVYVVFKQTPEDTNHIYVVHSFDDGITFSPPVRADYIADSISRFPTLAADAAGNPLVAFMKFDPDWTGSRYVVARSADHGNSFSSDVKASGFSGGTVCDCCPASLVASGNTVAMVYRDNLDNIRDAWTGISTDGGATFNTGMELDKTNWLVNSCPASGPDAVMIGDSIYTVFMSAASGTTKCYLSKASLSTHKAFMGPPLSSEGNYPRIASSGSASAIVWAQPAGNASQLALLFTNDITKGFPANYTVVTGSNVTNADVALFNGAVYVVWEDDNSGTVKFRKGAYTQVSNTADIPARHPFQIFPNPVNGNRLNIGFNRAPEGTVQYKITDMKGRVLQYNRTAIAANGLQLDITSLSSGSYLIEIQTGKEKYADIFIKE